MRVKRRKQKAENTQQVSENTLTVCALLLTDESGLGREVSDGHWDLFDDVLTNHLDVVLQLC